jgi:hypothetical protein
VCRDGSRDEQALYGECAASLEAEIDDDLSLATPTIETSQGTFTFDRVESVFGTLGEDGCVRRLDVTVAGAAEHCWLTLGAQGLGRGLTVDLFDAEFGGCAGFTGTNNAFSEPGTPFRLTYEGLTCESVASGRACFTGAFTFGLDGTLVVDDGYDLALEDQALVLTGTICGQPFGSCPQP